MSVRSDSVPSDFYLGFLLQLMTTDFNFCFDNQDIKVLLLNPVAKNPENAVEDFSGLKPNNCGVSTLAA